MKWVTIVTAVFVAGSLQVNAQSVTASKVAPGIISTGKELSQTVAPSGREIYFARMGNDRNWDIMYSERSDGKWSAPVEAPFNSEHTDADPYFTWDGSKLFFLSMRPKPGAEASKEPDIWYVEKQEGGWSNPVHLESVNTEEYGEAFMSLTEDQTLVFASNRPNIRHDHRIFMAEYDGTTYAPARPLDVHIRTEGFPNPLIGRRGEYLIFESAIYEGFGKDDLFIVFRQDDGWSDPVNLGEDVNSDMVEGAPFVTADGEHLFFARIEVTDGEMKSDIYQIPFKPVLESAMEKVSD